MAAPNLPLTVLAVQTEAADGWLQALAAQPGLRVIAGEASRAPDVDAVLLRAHDAAALAALLARPGLAELAYEVAVVVATGAGGTAGEASEAELLRLGVEALVADADAAQVARALHHAHVRKQVERTARTAYATDLATGLPHQAQLLEHVAQLIALREREPAPLVLIALRTEGVQHAAAQLGGEAANVLRRKIAVRLRGGLRASDVVAALGPDHYAVMLGRVDMVSDGDGVAAKLLRALEQPFILAGQPCHVKASFGLASYPLHGNDAAQLLQRAVAQAAMLATVGGEDTAGVVHSTFTVIGGGAANDEPP